MFVLHITVSKMYLTYSKVTFDKYTTAQMQWIYFSSGLDLSTPTALGSASFDPAVCLLFSVVRKKLDLLPSVTSDIFLYFYGCNIS